MLSEAKTFYLDGQTLTCQQLDEILKNKLQIDLSQKAWKRVITARNAIQKLIEDPKKVVYGVNTGFGNFANVVIAPEQRKHLQLNLIRSHSVGVGKSVHLNIIRRMMILRINTLAKGRSGISSRNLKKIIQAFHVDYLPEIPEKGTVGASGDLAPLSHLVLGLLGEGRVWDEDTKQFVNAKQIMKKKQLQPLELNQKQGLALINGTQFMASIISEVVTEATRLLQTSIIIFAMAVQIFGLDSTLFEPAMLQIYKQQDLQFGQILQKISSFLDHPQPSELHRERMTLNPQELQPASLVNFIQALSGVSSAIKFCNKMIKEQINGATDNPLIYLESDGFKEIELISAGNFHGEYVAKASDFLAMALFNFGKFSEARIERYINGRISKLAPFLTREGGLNSGYMIIQYTSAALLSETKVLVKPASVDSITTSSSQEDHVSMGGFAARKCRTVIDNMAQIVAIQMLMALEAIDLLEKLPSKKIQKFREQIRAKVPRMGNDRYYNAQIVLAKELILHNYTDL